MAQDSREFQAQLLGWTEVHELSGGWPPSRLLSLLANLEVDGVSEDDALEMAILALQDHDVDEAAELVLEIAAGESMRSGIRQGLAHELTEERPWEDFADISQQAEIFNSVALLQQAFPREFDKPDAVSVVVRIDTTSEKGLKWLGAATPDPALMLRIVAGGMDNRAVLKRLFGDALAGKDFAEAGAILWRATRTASGDRGHEFALASSHQWFGPLRHASKWTVQAWPDPQSK